jgi:peptidyl-prolyl cis-trans isomerase C
MTQNRSGAGAARRYGPGKRHQAVGVVLALAVAVTAGASCSQEPKTQSSSSQRTGPGTQTAAELSAPVATIDGHVITVDDFQQRINEQSPYIRARYTSMEQKRVFLDNLVRFEVLAQEAQRRGFDKDPDVVRTMKQVMIQKLMKSEFEDRFTPDNISEAEMQAFYNQHRDEYVKPEEIRVAAIIVKDSATATKVAAAARSETGRTNKGFRDLVSQYSIDNDSKVRGGDLRYFGRETTEVPKPVVTAAFDLKNIGDVAGPIKADGTFYVIKQTGHRKPMTKTYEDVKRQIQNRLYRERRTEAQKSFIDNLRKSAKITIDDKALSTVRVEPGSSQPPAGGHAGHDHGGPAPAPVTSPTAPPGAVPPSPPAPGVEH